jgi:hypothetical protein
LILVSCARQGHDRTRETDLLTQLGVLLPYFRRLGLKSSNAFLFDFYKLVEGLHVNDANADGRENFGSLANFPWGAGVLERCPAPLFPSPARLGRDDL